MQTFQKTSFNIEATSHRGDFKLSENGRKILELKYKNWYSGIAEAYLDREKIQLRPKNWWSGKIEISKNGKRIGEIDRNAKLEMRISFENGDGQEKAFTLKNKGTWKFRFEVSCGSEESVMTLTPVNAWKPLDFEVQILSEHIPAEELAIYAAYACKLYHAHVFAG